MKFFIPNYNTPVHTEATYLNHIFNGLDGCSSVLFNPSSTVSIYDALDMSQPDVIITHGLSLHKDYFVYLSEHKDIELVLNITMVSDKDLHNIETMLENQKINCKLAFINHGNNQYKSKLNIISIYHGVDIFLNAPKINYNIDTLNMVHRDDFQRINTTDTYHYMSNYAKLHKSVDKIVTVFDLVGIYQNYKEIKFFDFIDQSIVQQSFFDAIYYHDNVSFCGSKEQLEIICKLLKVDNLKDFAKIKQCVKEKHTCLNRAKSLLSQLKCSDLVTQLSVMMKEVKL